ncbi:MAG: guanylate kinase [Candidatus Aminicenantes bacterium]|nr:guanylate kinase [Candidatus Aminicenantes bacterium]MDH5704641.1 guanylate kinase [Candidatus Aminicenantes bacterium]
MLFIITGPSGCGKSTLVQQVLKRVGDIWFSVSHTTRQKRDSEKEGKDYYFVSKAEFEQMIKEERLVEWTVFHDHNYGTSKREVEKKGTRGDLLLDIDVHGAEQIKSKLKKAIFIFILPPSFEELKRRLETRGQESAEFIQERLEVARKDIRAYPQFDYIVINDELEEAVQDLESIIRSRRCSLESRKKEIVPILRSFSED